MKVKKTSFTLLVTILFWFNGCGGGSSGSQNNGQNNNTPNNNSTSLPTPVEGDYVGYGLYDDPTMAPLTKNWKFSLDNVSRTFSAVEQNSGVTLSGDMNATGAFIDFNITVSSDTAAYPVGRRFSGTGIDNTLLFVDMSTFGHHEFVSAIAKGECPSNDMEMVWHRTVSPVLVNPWQINDVLADLNYTHAVSSLVSTDSWTIEGDIPAYAEASFLGTSLSYTCNSGHFAQTLSLPFNTTRTLNGYINPKGYGVVDYNAELMLPRRSVDDVSNLTGNYVGYLIVSPGNALGFKTEISMATAYLDFSAIDSQSHVLTLKNLSRNDMGISYIGITRKENPNDPVEGAIMGEFTLFSQSNQNNPIYSEPLPLQNTLIGQNVDQSQASFNGKIVCSAYDNLEGEGKGMVLCQGYLYNQGIKLLQDNLFTLVLVSGEYIPNSSGDCDGTPNVSLQSPGTFDGQFGSGGIVEYSQSGYIYSGKAVAVDAYNRVVVAGFRKDINSGLRVMALWRYYCDGTLDITFNGSGMVVFNGLSSDYVSSEAFDIAIDANGKIVVAGRSRTASGTQDMTLWRLNENGTFDTSFNTTGMVTHDIGGSDDKAIGITIDQNGKIVVAGDGYIGSEKRMVLWRYGANGLLDTTFNGTGYVTHAGAYGGYTDSIGNDVVVDGNGKIIVVGSDKTSSFDEDMAVWRFNPDGSIDTTFASNGLFTHHNAAGGNGGDAAMAVTLTNSNTIIVTGYSNRGGYQNFPPDHDMVIWRLTSSGLLDTSFNGSGIVVSHSAAGGNGYDGGMDIMLDANGRIVVVGSSMYIDKPAMTIWRYSYSGSSDTTFGQNGIVFHGHTDWSFGSAVAFDANNRIVATGERRQQTGEGAMIIGRIVP